ncbi:aminodeoxychorismate/anthranilate synthase component II [Bacillus sp. DTU_2020_1000418_1_SI_GHA_SEK_038]|uniref:anthranilate synthase component II n=1 Tax=Bacillus sp. DTU_2020_1000418_1_SI_GHA_SEK_038 TaxID=3077585 RepID=UPI0028E630FF|nr:aminodeoxychorismate/anthranilate synthase component II [Bacillus sp. DTU_2020_1000418_1_SI_GHA_SEK_038]WNS73806.1 aminodeoxychorismate/anthranilate synthase component II [Bacillus sp. DTU_2020_1000418_1_SI_GHA_SEK_038]
MILLIDNYDSFTYNLYQYLGELGEEVHVARNDRISIEEINAMEPAAIVLSPGPGRPEDAGLCPAIIQAFYETTPILGICLGHQAIGYTFGADIKKANQIMHGKISKLKHNGLDLFEYLPQPIDIMRYHSLIISEETLPDSFKILAKSMDDNEIMAIKHKKFPLYGLQFHPESIGTMFGKRILENFLNHTGRELKNEKYLTENL